MAQRSEAERPRLLRRSPDGAMGRGRRRGGAGLLLPVAALVLGGLAGPVFAQATAIGQPMGLSSQERQMFGNGNSGGGSLGGGGGGLDVSNPIDLINRLRRSSAMDDAPPPSSAVDQALKALEAQSGPAPQVRSQAKPAGGPQPVAQPSGLQPRP